MAHSLVAYFIRLSKFFVLCSIVASGLAFLFSLFVVQTGPMVISLLKIGWALAGLAVSGILIGLLLNFSNSLKLLHNHIATVSIALILFFTPLVIVAENYSGYNQTDVTTNSVDRLMFTNLKKDRGFGANPLKGPLTHKKVRLNKETKMLESLIVKAPIDITFRHVSKLIFDKGWTIKTKRPPGPNKEIAIIEAHKTDNFLKTPDDLIIRLKADGEQHMTIIDLRSAARFGALDFGRNQGHLIALHNQFKFDRILGKRHKQTQVAHHWIKQKADPQKIEQASLSVEETQTEQEVIDDDDLAANPEIPQNQQLTTGAINKIKKTKVKKVKARKRNLPRAGKKRSLVKAADMRIARRRPRTKRQDGKKQTVTQPEQALKKVWDIISAPFQPPRTARP